jgi:polyhydroxyalkanoate synthesis regulator phasin
MSKKLPKDFLKLLKSVTAKRPKTVIDHILKHGQITSEELKDKYGYNHPPRAVRDVRERGIPIITFRVTGSDGRRIGAYKFGDPMDVRSTRLSGRTTFKKDLKDKLIELNGKKCNITLKKLSKKELQIDHRIPFEIGGDTEKLSTDPDDYMLLSASANRAKSWSCENCPNWEDKKPEVCKGCYWAFPEDYQHVATKEIRRLDIIWSDKEVEQYDAVKEESEKINEDLPEYVKDVLASHLNKNS